MATAFKFGGDEGDRTPDLLNAIQALSQLSYAPKALHALLYGKKRALSIVFLLLFTLILTAVLTKLRAASSGTAFRILSRQCFSIPHQKTVYPFPYQFYSFCLPDRCE